MARNIFCPRGSVALVAGTAALLFLTGCVGDMPHRGAWVAAPQNKSVERAYALMEVPHFAVAPVRVRVLAASPAKPKAPQPSVRIYPKRQP